MASFEVIFPDYLDGYEHETESKGYLTGLRVIVGTRSIEFTVYDRERLSQEVTDEINAAGFFAEVNLLVVPRVTREAINAAINSLSAGEFRQFFA
jgi:hypothetical protein